jgi:2'-5' RNA ligase
VRAFVAIPIDEPVKDALVRAIDPLKRAGADVRWVSRETMHITLWFLGEIDSAQEDRFRNLARAEAAKSPALSIDLCGLGQFPPRGAPRVVWAGCRGPDVAKLEALAGVIGNAAKTIGVPPDPHPWNAHVTIGRVKSPKNARTLSDRIAAAADQPFGSQTVRAFVLYKSTLTPDGPIYEELETFALTA